MASQQYRPSVGRLMLRKVLESATQDEVAEKCEVSQSTVCRWSLGISTPTSLRALLALAREYGIPIPTWGQKPEEIALTSASAA